MSKAYAVLYFLPDVIGFKEDSIKAALQTASDKERFKRGGVSATMQDISLLSKTRGLGIEKTGKGDSKSVVLRKTPEFIMWASSEIKKETPVMISMCREFAKAVIPYASSCFSVSEKSKPEESDLILKASNAYAKTDPAVSAWLAELAAFKKGGK